MARKSELCFINVGGDVMRQWIPVDVDDLPDIFDIDLAGETYTFRIDYNQVADYYTITISHDDSVVVSQEPLLLGQRIGASLPGTNLPAVDLRVMDESGQAEDAGAGNFGDSVQIYLDTIDPNGSETESPEIEPLGYDPDGELDTGDEEVSY